MQIGHNTSSRLSRVSDQNKTRLPEFKVHRDGNTPNITPSYAYNLALQLRNSRYTADPNRAGYTLPRGFGAGGPSGLPAFTLQEGRIRAIFSGEQSGADFMTVLPENGTATIGYPRHGSPPPVAIPFSKLPPHQLQRAVTLMQQVAPEFS